MNQPFIGYKQARAGSEKVVVTLQIPVDSRNNLGRPKILNREMASQVTDRARVLLIQDEQGRSQKEAISCRYPEQLLYIVGQEVTDWRQNWPEGPCGISFQGSRERIFWEKNHYNGINRIQGENGWLTMEQKMIGGEIDQSTLRTFTRQDDDEERRDFEVNVFRTTKPSHILPPSKY